MAAFRILDQAPQYLLADGSVNAGGKLYFYQTDLSTPQNTWSDQALTVLNSNPVIMDAAGRSATDIWGDGEYGVVMTDADDVAIWTRNNVEIPGGDGTAIPALVAGQFMTNDGSILQWQAISQVPDPTGLANHVLTSDGTGVPVWQQPDPADELPPIPDGGITVSSTTIIIGDQMIQWGTGSLPFSGGHTTSGSVVFGTAFGASPTVVMQATGGGVTGDGYYPILSVTSVSTTGFNAGANVNEGGTGGGTNIGSAVNFTYTAIGQVA